LTTRLIVNPSAGGGRAAARALALKSVLERDLGALEWRETRSADEVTALAAESARRGDFRVLVAGGDGTVHFAAAGLVGTGTALGILPVGTGNDIAHAAGVPDDPRAAVSLLAQGHVRELDLASANGRVYACVLGLGMDSVALERINGARFLRRGRLLYALAALETALVYRPERASIAWEGGRFEGEVVFAAITNTASYAGGMKISPRAEVDDAKLDLCVIPRLGLARTLASFHRVLDGRHVGLPGIVVEQAPSFRIESERPLRVTLDGELTDLTTPLDVNVLPAALRVLGAPVASSEARVGWASRPPARGRAGMPTPPIQAGERS
jgi:diacylglycerol kinase (ATP)